MKISYQLINKPNKSIKNKTEFLKEIDNLLNISWGEFDRDYINKSIMDSYVLCLAYCGKEIVGLAPIKKINIFGSDVYSFGLTAVMPKFRNKNILKNMGIKLIKKVVLENIFKLKFKIELIFITPNIRTISTIAKYADFIYPNPYVADKEGRITEADDETWERVNEFLRVSEENVTKLEREGMVMEGFYELNPHLAFKNKISHINRKFDLFGEKYLYNKPGRELVVRALVGFKGVLNAIRTN